MVDPVNRTNAGSTRIQEEPDRNRRQDQDEGEEEKKKKKKDEFDRDKNPWRKLLPSTDSSLSRMKDLKSREASILNSNPKIRLEDEKEKENTTSENIPISQNWLAIMGVVDLKGKPRVLIIATYVAMALLIGVSIITILRLLWR